MKTAPSQVLRWFVCVLGLAWCCGVVPVYTDFFIFWQLLEMQCVTKKKRQAAEFLFRLSGLFPLNILISFRQNAESTPSRVERIKNRLVKTLYFILLSFRREPMLYPNITHSVEPNTNIVWLNRQHYCVTFWKCHIHILAQRPDILTDGLIIFLSSSRYVSGQYFRFKPLRLPSMCF